MNSTSIRGKFAELIGRLHYSSRQNAVLNRSNYKEIWNDVSRDEDRAKTAVSGSPDEESHRVSGEYTRDMIIKLVGVSPVDTVLEIGAGVGRVGAVLAPICKEWIGVDVSENMLGHTRNRLARFSNVRTVATNG
ncbi:MAG TPA: methyltransferase domain-containing protein, partial [Beijerinckiaceae bacterium]|nr:methyltransferase domain-containing protein [Beijerinckiaceae bacterium]